MPADGSMRSALLGSVPMLRAFATLMCGDVELADKLLQNALQLALTNRGTLHPGGNISAWLHAILRNYFHSEFPQRRHTIESTDSYHSDSLKSEGGQAGQSNGREFRAALQKLSIDQREALILVGASNFAYEDAAKICGCAVGTIKSRVNRARLHLVELLQIDEVDERGLGQQAKATQARDYD